MRFHPVGFMDLWLTSGNWKKETISSTHCASFDLHVASSVKLECKQALYNIYIYKMKLLSQNVDINKSNVL